MFRMDLGSGEYGGHVVVALRGELDLLYAPAVATALGDSRGLVSRGSS